MIQKLSAFVDTLSEFLAHRKGLLPLTGMGLVLLNFLLQFAGDGWVIQSNLFLHLGVLVALFGLMLARAL